MTGWIGSDFLIFLAPLSLAAIVFPVTGDVLLVHGVPIGTGWAGGLAALSLISLTCAVATAKVFRLGDMGFQPAVKALAIITMLVMLLGGVVGGGVASVGAAISSEPLAGFGSLLAVPGLTDSMTLFALAALAGRI